jgi:hypothetical protein
VWQILLGKSSIGVSIDGLPDHYDDEIAPLVLAA